MKPSEKTLLLIAVMGFLGNALAATSPGCPTNHTVQNSHPKYKVITGGSCDAGYQLLKGSGSAEGITPHISEACDENKGICAGTCTYNP